MRSGGILDANMLTINQPVVNNTVPVTVQNSGTDQFSIDLTAGTKLAWEVCGAFRLGAVSGFTLLAHCSAAPTLYLFQALVTDLTSQVVIAPNSGAITSEVAFSSAAGGIAGDFTLQAWGEIIANVATTFSFQFAQNVADPTSILMYKGTTIKFWRF